MFGETKLQEKYAVTENEIFLHYRRAWTLKETRVVAVSVLGASRPSVDQTRPDSEDDSW